jgi:hypothetical protein
LVSKVLSIPEYKTQYIKYLNDLIDKKYDLFYIDYKVENGLYKLVLRDVFTSNIGNSKDLYNLDQISKLPFVDVKEVENEIYKSDNR